MSKKIIAISLTAIILVAVCSVLVIQYTNAGTENSTTVKSDNPDPTITPSETNEVKPTANSSEIINSDKELGSLKEKIVELFPNILPGSLHATSDSNHWIPEIKYIVYENALTKNGTKYKIKVDSATREIILYEAADGIHARSGKPDISLEEAEDIALVFLKKLKGDRYDEVIKESEINTQNWHDTVADVRFKRAQNNITFDIGTIQLTIDLKTGDVVDFYQNWPDFKNSTFSSPEPDITVEEAKKITETTITERYPETKGCIEYCNGSKDSDTIKPRWYDHSVVLWYEKDLPVRLAWVLNFEVNTGTNDDENGMTGYSMSSSAVDAHSGEILWLASEGIRISKSDQYLKA